MTPRTLILFLLPILLSVQAFATDRFFSDIEATSKSGRYKVTAKSPDNAKEDERRAFQASFTYRCTDTKTGKLLWTRKQPMSEPEHIGAPPELINSFPEEGSPSAIYVSDKGDAVIHTAYDELVVIDVEGNERGKFGILDEGFTKQDREDHVVSTTAGPMWAGRSLWYFTESGGRQLFVVRTWWGKRLIVNLHDAKAVRPDKAIHNAIATSEKAYVLHILDSVLDDKAELCKDCGTSHDASNAAYLAGALGIREAIPALRKLEKDPSINSSVSGDYLDDITGMVSPHNYRTFGTRQNAHLSLRRLGETPGAFPCTEFDVEHRVFEKQKPYVRKPVPGARHTHTEKIKKGMTPEQVINFLDCPDYIHRDDWQYDMDTKKPYTFTIEWTEDRKVKKTGIARPALWEEGLSRDSPW